MLRLRDELLCIGGDGGLNGSGDLENGLSYELLRDRRRPGGHGDSDRERE